MAEANDLPKPTMSSPVTFTVDSGKIEIRLPIPSDVESDEDLGELLRSYFAAEAEFRRVEAGADSRGPELSTAWQAAVLAHDRLIASAARRSLMAAQSGAEPLNLDKSVEFSSIIAEIFADPGAPSESKNGSLLAAFFSSILLQVESIVNLLREIPASARQKFEDRLSAALQRALESPSPADEIDRLGTAISHMGVERAAILPEEDRAPLAVEHFASRADKSETAEAFFNRVYVTPGVNTKTTIGSLSEDDPALARALYRRAKELGRPLTQLIEIGRAKRGAKKRDLGFDPTSLDPSEPLHAFVLKALEQRDIKHGRSNRHRIKQAPALG